METSRRGFLKTVGFLAAAVASCPQRILDIPPLPTAGKSPAPSLPSAGRPYASYVRACSTNKFPIYISFCENVPEDKALVVYPGEWISFDMNTPIFVTVKDPDERLTIETFVPGGSSGGAGSYARVSGAAPEDFVK